ncbi:MAG: valine--tRNA ligase, partial [Alphaproteobacteria bacterium]|nr:valine--tRNA ligase [Alphaproteobacteria bacterium]
LAHRTIPIVADEHSDPEKGTGAVKITPGHDFNDFEVGKRHHLPLINILNKDGTLNDLVPEAYRGLDRDDARKVVLADLEALDLVDRVEPITHAVPHDEKTKTVVLEPLMTEQWYCNVKPLADKAIAAVEQGRTKFVPEQWTNIYFNWLRNIHPWCISRQLWWGHQIPAWYDEDGKIYVAMSDEEAQAQAPGKKLTRDPDVLDTWFSSALWPFSTLGWPDQTPELARYYPTSVLSTAFDIIFFWVARMMMMGIHFMGDVPFRQVFIHTRVLDEKGSKMSKTKGNVIDPIDLVDEFGADALRFTLALAAGTGRDMRIGPTRVEPNRNFATKLWNTARFCEMNGCVTQLGFDPTEVTLTANKWIVGEVAQAVDDVARNIETMKFNEASSAAYHFVYDVFCDWYIEIAKPIFQGADEAAKAETRATTAWARDQILKILHPFMPYITEELWARIAEGGAQRETLLIEAPWPVVTAPAGAEAASAEMNWVIALVSGVRSVRTEMNVPPSAKIALLLKDPDPQTAERLARHKDVILQLARLTSVEAASTLPKGTAQFLVGETVAGLPLGDVIDFAKERTRLEKELKKATDEIARFDAKLGNEQFVAKAPEDVLTEQREKRLEAMATAARLKEAVARLAT